MRSLIDDYYIMDGIGKSLVQSVPPLADADASPRVPATGRPASSGKRIPSLDGLRALSIGLVLISHVMSTEHPDPSKPLFVQVALAIFGNGQLGVEVFFVISGFLITHLLLVERSRRGRISLKHFYIRRVFRICPAFYCLILAVMVLSLLGMLHVPAGAMAHAATFTWLYNFKHWDWYLAHSWSLSVEEQFYLLWPITLVIAGPRRACWLAIFIILFIPFTRAGMVLPVPRTIHRICYILSAGRFDLLMFGCLAALLWKSAGPFFARPSRMIPCLCALFALAAIIAAFGRQFYPRLPYHPWFAAVSDSIIGLGIVLGIAYVVANPRSFAGRLLNTRALIWIGVLSYSLYLWQQLFLPPDPTHVWQKMPLNLLFVFAAGIASYYLIEKPMIRLRVRLSHDPVPSGPAL